MRELTSDDTCTLRIRTRNRAGLHARASVKLVQLANSFVSEITVYKDHAAVNGKSIMGLLTLVAQAAGLTLTIKAQGEDARDAAYALARLIDNGLGEGVVE